MNDLEFRAMNDIRWIELKRRWAVREPFGRALWTSC